MDNYFFKKEIKFKCQASSNCCVSRGLYGFVYLSNKDALKIANFLNISNKIFKKKYCEITDGYLHLKEIHKNGNCQFLDKKKCSIYKSRPTQCRTWPFWAENMNAKKWNRKIINFCPGIGKGKIISFYDIQEKINLDLKNDKQISKEKK